MPLPVENLIEQIEKELGSDVAKKISNIGLNASIYSLYIASVHRKTPEEIAVELAMFKIKYPKHSDDFFYQHLRDCHEDKFSVDIEHCGCYLDTHEVEYYLATNMSDMADDGAYPYAVLATMPLNAVYPVCESREYRVFKFNGRGYDEIVDDYSEEIQAILTMFGHGPY